MKSEINCFTHNLNGNDVKKGEANEQKAISAEDWNFHPCDNENSLSTAQRSDDGEKRHDSGADTKTTSIEQRHNRVYIDIKPC